MEPPSSARGRKSFFGRLSLKAEIGIAVVIKLLILFLLWKAFFSAPQAEHMRMPAPQVTQHVLAVPTNSPSTASEVSHDSHR